MSKNNFEQSRGQHGSPELTRDQHALLARLITDERVPTVGVAVENAVASISHDIRWQHRFAKQSLQPVRIEDREDNMESSPEQDLDPTKREELAREAVMAIWTKPPEGFGDLRNAA